LGYAQSAAALTRIGVGYDGSRESKDALALARELASRHHAAVRALRVVSIPGPLFVGPESGSWRDSLDEDLKEHEREMAALEGVQGEAKLGFADDELVALSGQVEPNASANGAEEHPGDPLRVEAAEGTGQPTVAPVAPERGARNRRRVKFITGAALAGGGALAIRKRRRARGERGRRQRWPRMPGRRSRRARKRVPTNMELLRRKLWRR
jgi:nucleotide-binding universal stress UspA family protein